MRRTRLLLLSLTVIAGCSKPPSGDQPLQIIGSGGAGKGQFSYPRAIVAANDRLYVADKSGRIQAFSYAGEPLFYWSMPVFKAGKPVGLGAGPDGLIYVPDTHYARVLVFSADGERLEEHGEFGDGPGQFRLPTDVVVDRDGFIFVSEYGGNDRVSKFSPDWKYLFSFGGADAGDARMLRPQCMTIGPDDALWIADACNHRICRFSRDGEFLGAIGELGDEPGQFRFPYGVEFLADGTLAVAEYGGNRVQRVSQSGAGLGFWGGPGRAAGQLASPWALARGAQDRLYIVDSGNNRLQVIAGGGEDTWRVHVDDETRSAVDER